jgi:CRP-like cAMP-binding protein
MPTRLRLPELRVVPSPAVLLHEECDPQRVERLSGALVSDGVLRNPPIAAPLDDGTYVVLDGAVTVRRRGMPTLTREQGSFFGEIALLDGGPRIATVLAHGPVTTLMITRSRFLKLLRDQPAIAVSMVAELAGRLRATEVG